MALANLASYSGTQYGQTVKSLTDTHNTSTQVPPHMHTCQISVLSKGSSFIQTELLLSSIPTNKNINYADLE